MENSPTLWSTPAPRDASSDISLKVAASVASLASSAFTPAAFASSNADCQSPSLSIN